MNHSEGEAVIGRSHLRIDEFARGRARADAHRSEDDGRCAKDHGCH
jgi:hypothetical protein